MPRLLDDLRALPKNRYPFMILVGLPLGWVAAIVSALYLSVARVVTSWTPGQDVWFFGRDFSVFYVGGALAREGNWSVLYDPARFTELFNQATGLALPAGGPVFRYPPPTGFAFASFSSLSLGTALALWTVFGLAAYVAACRLLGLSPAAAVLVFVSVPVYGAIALGQNTLFFFLVVAGAAVAARRRRPLWLGLVLGLLVLKPQLALGPALWWLSSPMRHRRELAGAALSGGSILAASAVAAPDAWILYLRRLPTLADPGPTNRVWYLSGLDFFRMLLGTGIGGTVAWVAVTSILVAASVLLFRRLGHELSAALAVAIVVSMLVSPHVVVYDWLLLVVAGALLWDRVPRTQLLGGAVALGLVALHGPELTAWQMKVFSAAFHPAYPLLAAVAILLLSGLRTLHRTTPTAGVAGT